MRKIMNILGIILRIIGMLLIIPVFLLALPGFFLILSSSDDSSQRETDFPLSVETQDNQSFKRLKSLAVFNFRAFLNVAMLLTDSENAKKLRSKILGSKIRRIFTGELIDEESCNDKLAKGIEDELKNRKI